MAQFVLMRASMETGVLMDVNVSLKVPSTKMAVLVDGSSF